MGILPTCIMKINYKLCSKQLENIKQIKIYRQNKQLLDRQFNVFIR